ncbi:beta-1,6-N-acetylglucosaminyltransferase [Sphingomonas sp. Leaf4]|uniref:beta-1,6-N-acetylglucosaminyltransferase n=1 Tax=Sphingomonas sp. Leaf4 TaxID=2876553 RepID=UPI0022A789E0|nr:beta-1,6-N-acetylglucosaminyltransferase [Sphingomonas sp. Leaf4]
MPCRSRATRPAGCGTAGHVARVDARTPRATYDAMVASIGERPRTSFVRRRRCFWSGIGIVRATMELIYAAERSDIRFDRATLLSGADYPIKSAAEIAAILDANPTAEFIEAFAMKAPNRWSEQEGVYRAPGRVERFHFRFRSRAIAIPGWRRKLPYNHVAHGGGQWWTLTHAALRHIADTGRSKPWLLRFYANTMLPDEGFIQTILANSPFGAAIANDDLRLTIWNRPEPPYPALLGPTDFDVIAKSPALFARKLSLARFPALYDRIDAELLHSDRISPETRV